MSVASEIPLTEEQEKFLQEVEEEFKDRYTEKDEEFRAVFEAKPVNPPIIEDWKSNHFRRKNWNPRHRGGDRPPQGESSHPRNFRGYNYRASRWGLARKDPW